MGPFAYSNSPYSIRDDLIEAYRHAWRNLAAPGNWWTGVERVAIAQETRNASSCSMCAQRKQSLSPFAPIAGDHNATTALAREVVDVVHRVTTDPSRLTRTWVEGLTAYGVSAGHYVEVISVVVTTLCIDSFHQALGFDLEPLPEPQPGQPLRYIPRGTAHRTAFVPMIADLGDPEFDLWPASSRMVPNVVRAMSLVPDAVRLMKTLSTAQYLPLQDVGKPSAEGGRAISRAQIEYIAARVSVINDCFY